jgi:hypothetical protein
MKIKILYHFMPWEIDYALLTFTQLKKSSYYIPDDITIEIDSVLNLSSYIINWEESKIPKQFFIEKYKNISSLLDCYTHNPKTFIDNTLYGHLNLQKESLGSDIDYYINICPDMYFQENLLYSLIEGAQHIKNEYFVITPQIHKLWDNTWDEITHPKYLQVSYDQWDKVDIFDIRNDLKSRDSELSLTPTLNNKWAGWFDLYSKKTWEDLIPVHENWEGYGPHDWYSLMITEHVKKQGVDFQQYVLEGQVIFEYSVGSLKSPNDLSSYYKNNLVLNKIPNQRKLFESKMQEYLNKGIEMLNKKNII